MVDRSSLEHELCVFVDEYGSLHTPETRWRVPLLGIADAADPRFAALREVTTRTHTLPGDLLPGARSVLCYFLPLERGVVWSNRAEEAASTEWARAYLETNALLQAIGSRLESILAEAGAEAVATPPTHRFDRELLVSDWSHRHVARIAGLGEFGLNRMLITPSGCCGRLGSVITSLSLEPTSRSNTPACLYYHDGRCTACVKRCHVGALKKTFFDRARCYRVCLENEVRHASLGKADVCGNCLVGLPCSMRDPVATLKNNPKE